MTKLGTEKASVQSTLIEYACEIGWEYVNPDEALSLRSGKSGLLFREVFSEQTKRLNSDFITDSMIEDLAKQLERLPARIEGNLQAWEYLKGLKTVFVSREKRVK